MIGRFDVDLRVGGVVAVQGNVVPGQWYHVQLGAAYFEDPGVLSTDVMSKGALRSKLLEMYGTLKEPN